VYESLGEKEPLGIERVQLPLDDALRRLRLVTVTDGIKFHVLRWGDGVANQLNERSNAAEIGHAII